MDKFEEWMTREEEADATQFADALDALAANRPLADSPDEAPELYAELRLASQIAGGAAALEPRAAYRARSRALIIDAAQPLARKRARVQPIVSRQSFLVPFASAAAAAGLTIAAVLGATQLGYGPGGTQGGGPVSATNLTQRSIKEDLRNLQSSLDAVVAAANRGDDLDPALLRSIAETTLNVTAFIEKSPEAVRVEDVISYYQAAATTHIKLGEIAPRVSSTPALVAAQRASEDGVFAASKAIQAIQEDRAHTAP